MSENMSTDDAWRQWGRQDPYFAVITDPKYRSDRLNEAARKDFFDTGRWHAEYVLDACRRYVSPGFQPKRALDFGCGVGRVALPLSELVDEVVGLDISRDMLAEAARNAESMGRQNVSWLLSDDGLSALEGSFDLVHSCITFQHIEMPRGRAIFGKLLERLSPGGAAAIQLTYGKVYHAERFGQPPVVAPQGSPASRSASADPEMQMNVYNLNELAFLMQQSGVESFHARFTNHGGELGVFLFFGKPTVST